MRNLFAKPEGTLWGHIGLFLSLDILLLGFQYALTKLIWWPEVYYLV